MKETSMPKQTVTRFHDFSYGHRVCGHESKCKYLHGHNGRVTFTCEAISGGLDDIGRVVDFSVMKSALCDWLEENWDHKMLLWTDDPVLRKLKNVDAALEEGESHGVVASSLYRVPFNPTAENMA
jgi:6-pyruvoyltetrahydropterin/6-carboxytetrahydropterin synthase